MSDELVPRPNTLPADFAKKLMSGIAQSRATTVIAGGGKDLLRMLKSGEWVFGQGNEEVQGGSQWVVNILSLAHGWVCWVEGAGNAKNSKRGEVMVAMTEDKPLCPPPIDGTPYKEQRALELKCVTGDDVGTEVRHEVTSIGGLRAIDGLLAKIQARLAVDPVHCCPVLVFGTDSYPHPKWGKVYTPVYEIVGWSDMNGNKTPAVHPKLAEAPAPAKAPAKPPLEPVSTAQAHVGQRRRRPAAVEQEEAPF
jgi:hypothetical protein